MCGLERWKEKSPVPVALLQEMTVRMGGSYSDCTEDGSDVPVQNLFSSRYTEQVFHYQLVALLFPFSSLSALLVHGLH